ncbi:MAG: U32 family peptidase C-terminal domain-containing protein, partial [Gammaproteobacteria bacterium]|nr:U32 family peptidase C-terminal domain-containing protein [Gammaproteobacteria bacterium]
EVKNRFAVGDTLELMTPDGNIQYQLDEIHQERNGKSLAVAPGSGHQVRIPVPDNIPLDHIDRGLLLRSLDKAIQT